MIWLRKSPSAGFPRVCILRWIRLFRPYFRMALFLRGTNRSRGSLNRFPAPIPRNVSDGERSLHVFFGLAPTTDKDQPETMRIFLYSIVLTSSLSAAPEVYGVSIRSAVPVKMRDGVALIADIYEPQADGKFPVLLARTPYGRSSESATAYKLAAHGYIVIIQDTRGRYDSDGEFYPFRYEIQDGYDTVERAAALPHSNGLVGMFGASYVGATQWLAAIAQPPHLAALFPQLTASEYYEGWTYQSGALMQWFTSSWATVLAIDTLRHKAEDEVDTKSWVWQLPLEKYR